jgi:DNA adenine methylase
VLVHKGKENAILNDWIAKNADLKVHYITHNYANSNYQTLVRDKDASLEVLITNYETKILEKPKTLFD